MRVVAALVALALVLGAGCGWGHKQIDLSQMVGKTAEDMVLMYGKPSVVMPMKDGRKAAVYKEVDGMSYPTKGELQRDGTIIYRPVGGMKQVVKMTFILDKDHKIVRAYGERQLIPH